MATLLNNPTLIKRVTSSSISTVTGMILTGPAPSTEWRNKIIRDRLLRNGLKPKVEPSVNDVAEPNLIPHLQHSQFGSNSGNVYQAGIMTISTIANEQIREDQAKLRNGYENSESPYRPLNRMTQLESLDNAEAPNQNRTLKYHPESSKRRRLFVPHAGVYIVNRISTSPYQVLELQNRPSHVSVKPETSWATIKSMGRNNPMYHYTGAEDTVSFNISWYCNSKENLDEVLGKCRLLESWSKADGYMKSPPILELLFGDYSSDETQIFGGHYFILWSAPYELRNIATPHPSYLDSDNMHHYGPEGTAIRLGMLYPQVATQELTFKRVTDHNLTRSEIIPDKLLKKTGIISQNSQSLNPLNF